MPSLLPGTPGAKEVFGIAIIRDDFSIALPTAAMNNYELTDGDPVLLTKIRRKEGGFSVLNTHRAEKSVFRKYIQMIDTMDVIFRFDDKVMVLTRICRGRIMLNQNILTAYHLRRNDKLLVVKGALIGMGCIPVEIWRHKLKKHGFKAAIHNMEKLDVFYRAAISG